MDQDLARAIKRARKRLKAMPGVSMEALMAALARRLVMETDVQDVMRWAKAVQLEMDQTAARKRQDAARKRVNAALAEWVEAEKVPPGTESFDRLDRAIAKYKRARKREDAADAEADRLWKLWFEKMGVA